jgi:rubrerythrin
MGTKTHRARTGRAHSEDEGAVKQVGVEVEESAATPLPAAETVLDEPGFVDFVVAGSQVSGEFRCADCGYGAVVRRELPSCPMCGGTVWESRGPAAKRSVD